MARKPKRIIQAEINHVRRLLEDNERTWTDKEIIDKLSMAERTFYRYKKKIEQDIKEQWEKQAQQDKDKWNKLRFGPLEKRALDIIEEMERSRDLCIALENADDTPPAVKLEASKWAVKFRVNIYYVLEHGPTPNIKVINNLDDRLQQARKLEIGRHT